MWDTILDCLEEHGPMEALTVSEAMCFSGLCVALQRWACGTLSGYTAKCEAKELCCSRGRIEKGEMQ